MYLSPDDAKSDTILVGAVVVFGGAARGFVSSLPLYPQRGLAALLLDLAWMVALTGLVPVLLARHRRDGPAAFALHVPSRGWRGGLLVAAPVAALGAVLAVAVVREPSTALTGQVGWVALATGGIGLDTVVQLAAVLAVSVGALLVVSFLAIRGREGFPRSPDTSLTQLVRTLGMGAAALALVLGLLRAIAGRSLLVAVASSLAAAGVVLLADRLVPPTLIVPRSAVVAPVVVVVIAHVLLTGGLFRGDLLSGLYVGALATTTTVATAALAQTRAGAWPALPLLLAVHWWPTCLSPVTIAGGVC